MKKREIEILAIVAIVTIFAIAAAVLVSSSNNITGMVVDHNDLKIPDEQCSKIAGGLATSTANVASEFHASGTMTDPCTGTAVGYTSYLDKNVGGFYSVVYDNGDVRGYHMGDGYILCTDGRAEVTSRLGVYYYNRGRGWGIYYLWQKNPHLEPPYKVEKCSTI
ncbi:hypothetical protein KY332_00635 [Candidatus Woesearchaeota archaeon]|nr:hypothetical protein [Candidatus Woesearchaeota archaeon]